MAATGQTPEMVTLTIDGKQVSVPKGTNLIDAAKKADVEVPHYCYHPHLSVAGNCRMCQVKVTGRPKLEIACNTTVVEGMEVLTHLTSKEVDDAQAATLEFILINHPLDCTVCDQAGHCKLQDYHYEYNARPSRFLEEKEHKVKAEPLGPTVMLDGERCIMCTRCIRFCDEVTETSELGMLNRGDKSVISVNKDKVLDNPLSGSVVDLCPVGALTHRQWRFNTRIWFTKQTDAICPGCSTGCNVKVASRDGEVVQVKARLNSEVNKEWLCDEGRYGFMRFLPAHRLTNAKIKGAESSFENALNAAKGLSQGETIIFIGGDQTAEDYAVLKRLIDAKLKGAKVVLSYRERTLSKTQAILISPDYAPNFKGAELAGLVSGALENDYSQALSDVAAGKYKNIFVVGDRGVLAQDASAGFIAGLNKASLVISLLTDATHPLAKASTVLIAIRSILERSGLVVNRDLRVQYTDKVVEYPDGTEPAWRAISGIATVLGAKLIEAKTDREATNWLLTQEPRFSGLTIKSIKAGGVSLKDSPGTVSPAQSEARV